MSEPAERTPNAYLIGAELALFAVHLSVIAGFARVLTGSWFVPLAVLLVVAEVIVVIARRAGIGLALTAGATLVAAALVSTWLLFADTTRALLPTGQTLTAAGDALRSGWLLFQEATPPVESEAGLVLATAGAVVFGVYLADWAAFRLWTAHEALVPALSLFVFCSLLGSGEYQVPTAASFAAAVLVFLLIHRVAAGTRNPGWVTSDVRSGSRRLVRSGAVIAVVAVVAGAAIGPRLPGAEDEAIVRWDGERAGGGQRVTVSPLVDIQRRLVDQADVELFTVRSNERAYWRLTSLDTFEDGIWRSSGRYSSVDGQLPAENRSTIDTREIDQSVEISSLSALWLPAAYAPTWIDAPQTVRFNEGSSTLIVDTDVETSDGFSYRVRSRAPSFAPQELQRAAQDVPDEIAEAYLALPASTTPIAEQTALAVTADTTTAYDAARALQDWFRSEFTYSLDIAPGHSTDAIEAFLADRVGYCEQFAGTFAVMARSLGIPARVAVGFTPGTPDPDDPGLLRVRGEHAHAWPEVWLGDYGWVSFEPTPGRGEPGAEAHTGAPEQQADEPVRDDADGATTTTLALESDERASAPTTAPAVPSDGLDDQDLAAGGGTSSPPSRALVALAVVLAWIVLYALGAPALLALRRSRRRSNVDSAVQRVQLAWDEALEALAAYSTVPERDETATEFVSRAGRRLPTEQRALSVLAAAHDAATFSGDDLDPSLVAGAEQACTAVEAAVDTRLRRSRRVLRRFDVRPLFRSRTLTPERRAVHAVH